MGSVTAHAHEEKESHGNRSAAPFDAVRGVHGECHYVCDDAPRGSGFKTDGELPAPTWTETMLRKDTNGCRCRRRHDLMDMSGLWGWRHNQQVERVSVGSDSRLATALSDCGAERHIIKGPGELADLPVPVRLARAGSQVAGGAECLGFCRSAPYGLCHRA